MPSPSSSFQFENSYAEELPDFYAEGDPMLVKLPALLQFNSSLADELGLGVTEFSSDEIAQIFAGQKLLKGSRPLAQAYAGHQFGGFSPQLGDGRGLLLGEVNDSKGGRYDIALKGSGPTVFSRGGDGKAAVAAVLREYLIGEAMHALQVPTTRALAAVATGEPVYRELPLPGAILTRVAASHIRVGTFQFFAARQRWDQVRQLADYSIARHDPQFVGDEDRYLLFLEAVCHRQSSLIANWMNLGFIHGVMNTDNMTISGETIDYGPCAFMEAYNPEAVFSSIDRQGRYAYKNQPKIAQWNLTRFAESLLPLMDEDDPEKAVPKVEKILNDFVASYENQWLLAAQKKLGIDILDEDKSGDTALAKDWLDLLESQTIDYTLAWRRLADAADNNSEPLLELFPSRDGITTWLERWQFRIENQSAEETAKNMRAVNPIYIPRNHLVEEALDAAQDENNLEPFERLLGVLSNPFEEREGFEKFAEAAPVSFTDNYETFCGT